MTPEEHKQKATDLGKKYKELESTGTEADRREVAQDFFDYRQELVGTDLWHTVTEAFWAGYEDKSDETKEL